MWPKLLLEADVYNDLLEVLNKSFDDGGTSKLEDLRKILSTPPKYTTLRCVNAIDNLKLVEKTINEREKEKFCGVCYKVYKHSMMDDVIIVEGMPTQTVNFPSKEVIVDVSCGAAVLRGSDIFIPGILAIHPDTKRGDAVSIFVDLQGKCLKGLSQPFGGPKLFIASGISLLSRKEFFSTCNLHSEGASKKGVGVKVHNNVFYHAPSLDNLLPSIIFPQNLPSLVCVHVLSPQPDSLVLDMCAAPGGKTCHIASLVTAKGRVVALDKNKGKVDRLKNNLKRLNFTNVHASAFDATKAFDPQADDSLNPPFHEHFFDSILVDAPCSGLGQRPCFSHRLLNRKQLASYPVVQRRILTNAIPLLKAGGALVYSTCTINPHENEAVVSWLLAKFPNVTLEKQDIHLGGWGWRHEGLSREQQQLLQRFDPSLLVEKEDLSCVEEQPETPKPALKQHLLTPESDTIGFFIAKFRKK